MTVDNNKKTCVCERDYISKLRVKITQYKSPTLFIKKSKLGTLIRAVTQQSSIINNGFVPN